MAINALTYGAAALAGSVVNSYFNPSKSVMTQLKPTSTPTYQFKTSGGGIGSNLIGSVMNKLGVTPFQGTSLGQSYQKYVPSFIQTGVSNVLSGKGLLGTDLNLGASQGEMFRGMNRMPDAPVARQVSPYRSGQDYSPSAPVAQVPLGRGRVGQALQRPQIQNFLAQAVNAKIPARIVGAQIDPGSLQSISLTGRLSVKRSATRTKKYTSDKASEIKA